MIPIAFTSAVCLLEMIIVSGDTDKKKAENKTMSGNTEAPTSLPQGGESSKAQD